MLVKEVIKQLKKMPQDIEVFVEGYCPSIERWGNLTIDLVAHHYHENDDGKPIISECVIMPNTESCNYGIIKDDGEKMTDEEMKQYFDLCYNKK